MKKFISLFFMLIFIISIILITSCSDGNSQSNENSNNDLPIGENNAQASDAPEGTTQNPRFAVKEDIPEDLDFGGINFNIIYLTWGMFNDYYFAEEEIGEHMNDAIYRRTKNVEERFNITINPIPGN